MDINDNTQLTNTFLKGMNTDISDALIGDSEYRLAENLRYVTNTESNTGELRLIEGDVACALNVEGAKDRSFTILAATSIRDLIVLVVKEYVTETHGEHDVKIYDGWSVLKGTLEDTTLDLLRTFGPCKESLSNNKLSLVTRWEDDDNVKLYIADGKHPLMVFNIMQNNGDSISQVTNVKNIVLSTLNVDLYIAGSLKPALVQYSYKLYNTNGVSTNISPVSKLYKIEGVENYYSKGYKQDVKSDRGLRISGTIQPGFEKIELYRITYELNGQEPTIELIYTGPYSEDFKYDDGGQSAISSLSLAEYNSISGIDIIPAVIESKNDYLFAGNIKYQTYTYRQNILDWDARAYVSGDYYVDSDNSLIDCLSDILKVPIDADIKNDNLLDLSGDYDVYKWLNESSYTQNLKIGGRGVNISYEFICNNSEVLDYNIYNNAHINRRSATYDRNVSLWRDEVYRYGIVLYDEDGVLYPVKWIMDVRTPALKNEYSYADDQNEQVLSNTVGKITTVTESSLDIDNVIKSNTLGIRFTVNLPEHVVAYDIVRCNRGINDRRIVCQGVLSATAEHDGVLCPTGPLTLYPVQYADGDNDVCSESNINVLQFFSPEVSYQLDDVVNLLSVNTNKLKVIKKLKSISNWTDSALHNIPEYIIPHNTFSGTAYSYVYHMNITAHKETATSDEYYTIVTSPSDWDYIDELDDDGLIDNKGEIKDQRERNETPYSTYCKLYDDLFYSRYGVDIDLEEDSEQNVVARLVEKELIFDYSVSEFAKVADVPNWNEFATNAVNPQLTFRDDAVSIGGYTFYKWSVPYFLTEEWAIDSDIIGAFSLLLPLLDIKYRMPVGTTDISLLLLLELITEYDKVGILQHTCTLNKADVPDSKDTTVLCNIYSNAAPYGGYTNYARLNSIYYSHGNRYSADTTTCDVYDGDCFIKLYEFTPLHVWFNSKLKHTYHSCVSYAVPVETAIDINADDGCTYSRAFIAKGAAVAPCVQNQPANVYDKFTLTVPMYVYNTAYNSNSITDKFTGMEQEDIENNNYDCRVYYSLVKTNNEPIDNWTVFKAANYIDVDTRYGQITDLRLFNDQLIYWQTDATGVLSVNERTLLLDVNNTNIMLGTGDVLQRYDYLTTEYGMKPNQYAEVKSNTTLYWWDGYKKEILGYGGRNSGVVPMSKTKNVLNYINSREEIDACPTLAYDFKYNEVMFNVVNDGALTYNEMVQAFVSVYPHTYFLNKVLLRDGLLLTDEEHVRKWNTNDKGAESFGEPLLPMLKYVVNKASTEVKVFDNVRFGGRFYGGDFLDDENIDDLEKLTFKFNTPLKQHSELKGKDITNREYDFRFAIPRQNDWKYGGRMRGKTMQCELSSDSNSLDFSLQYITTKFRISWS